MSLRIAAAARRRSCEASGASAGRQSRRRFSVQVRPRPVLPLHCRGLQPIIRALQTEQKRRDRREDHCPQREQTGDFAWCHDGHGRNDSRSILKTYFNLELILRYPRNSFGPAPSVASG